MRFQVQSRASLSGLRIRNCRELWVGRRCGSDPVLLYLWCRPADVAPIWPLDWEPLYAANAALKSKKKKKKKKKEGKHFPGPRKKGEGGEGRGEKKGNGSWILKKSFRLHCEGRISRNSAVLVYDHYGNYRWEGLRSSPEGSQGLASSEARVTPKEG